MSTSRPLHLLLLAALTLLGGCGDALLAPDHRDALRSGLYVYQTWTERGHPAWWGHVELRVDRFDGTIRGSYRLPGQCSDGFGFRVDCVGRVGGRVYSDGTLRFGFDEGWLRHRGEVDRFSEAFGFWDTRLLGIYESGDFELLPY